MKGVISICEILAIADEPFSVETKTERFVSLNSLAHVFGFMF